MSTALRILLAFVLTLSSLLASPRVMLAAEPTFGTPVASAPLGQPLTVTSDIAGVDGGTVELLVRLVGKEPQVVVPANPGTVAGSWQAAAEIDVPSSMDCTCFFDGQSPPNSHIEFQFRVRGADGTTTLGPVGLIAVTDDRFQWRTIEQDLVRVHWYEGDEAFAQSAADVANTAIDEAAALLGSTLPAPVDLFVYATQEALLEAVAPNRENIAGQAHSTIATMFVWVPPDQDPGFSAVVVAHELTHLVFNETTDNPYHGPPRWLNEGIAVYLSEGYSLEWSSVVNSAARDGSIIPLDGLAGFFPSPDDQFTLAYGESVSAVDYFIRNYSDQTLWDLVRSYAQGLSDDDAFTAATGGDVAAFNAAWMASLGLEVREPLGPQPAPAGPVPSAWTNLAQPTPGPGASATPPGPVAGSPAATLAPGRSAAPTSRPVTPGEGVSNDSTGAVLLAILVGLAVLAVIIVLVILLQRGRTRRPPPHY
ncbi:MAG: peptidase MA family metallohydrolase [Candidatus Limnocylindrales bacterium]